MFQLWIECTLLVQCRFNFGKKHFVGNASCIDYNEVELEITNLRQISDILSIYFGVQLSFFSGFSVA